MMVEQNALSGFFTQIDDDYNNTNKNEKQT